LFGFLLLLFLLLSFLVTVRRGVFADSYVLFEFLLLLLLLLLRFSVTVRRGLFADS